MKITFQKIILNIAPTIIINFFGIILLNYMFKDYTYIINYYIFVSIILLYSTNINFNLELLSKKSNFNFTIR